MSDEEKLKSDEESDDEKLNCLDAWKARMGKKCCCVAFGRIGLPVLGCHRKPIMRVTPQLPNCLSTANPPRCRISPLLPPPALDASLFTFAPPSAAPITPASSAALCCAAALASRSPPWFKSYRSRPPSLPLSAFPPPRSSSLRSLLLPSGVHSATAAQHQRGHTRQQQSTSAAAAHTLHPRHTHTVITHSYITPPRQSYH